MLAYIAYIIALAAASATVLLTLQRRRWVWQSRILATLAPFATIVLAPTHDMAIDAALCGLALWATARAVQSLMPADTTLREFVAELRPSGNRHLGSHLMNLISLRVAGILLLLKNPADDAEAAKIREKRIIARDGALEAQRALPGSLGFSRLHWLALSEVFAVWLILQLTHLASPAATFALSVPVVLATAAYVLHGKNPGFASQIAAPHTSVVTTI